MKNSKAKGFTIVEVLFVLAIGGLILMMVFLAIPAINRWNNNSKRKADVSAILQAVSDYRLQNMGNFPGDDIAKNNLRNQLSNKLNIYANTAIGISFDSNTGTVSAVTAIDTVKVYNSAICNSSGGGASLGGSRDIVALYALDPSMSQCRQL